MAYNIPLPKAIRYLFSGGLAFISEYTSFLLLFYVLSVSSSASNALSFLLGLIVSFTLNKMWVFKGEHDKRGIHQMVLYLCLALFNLAITTVSISYLIEGGVVGYIAKALLIGLVATWNFLIFNRLIFRNT